MQTKVFTHLQIIKHEISGDAESKDFYIKSTWQVALWDFHHWDSLKAIQEASEEWVKKYFSIQLYLNQYGDMETVSAEGLDVVWLNDQEADIIASNHDVVVGSIAIY